MSALAPTRPVPPALELVAVGKEYAGSPPVRVLHGVDLRVDDGDFVTIVGQSGSGKSTLLHVAGTLDRPTSGRVLVAGVDTTELSDDQLAAVRSRHLGFVFQQFFLLEDLSALDNVALALAYQGVGMAERRARAGALLDRVGLSHRVHHLPRELSGGERQRVAIAALLAQQTRLCLLDEPLAHLDLNHQIATLELLARRARTEGVAFAMVLHDPNFALRYCDRALLLFGDGSHVAGPVAEVLDEESLSRLYGHPMRRVATPDFPHPVFVAQ